MWAVIRLKTQQFIGFIGVNKSEIVEPYLEILWRFDSNFWGNGYATEAAACVLSYAHPRKVMAFTAVMNNPSQNYALCKNVFASKISTRSSTCTSCFM